jgi:hypothetical protein
MDEIEGENDFILEILMYVFYQYATEKSDFNFFLLFGR